MPEDNSKRGAESVNHRPQQKENSEKSILATSSVQLKVNADFRDLIPPLSNHEYLGLEEDIKHFGCRKAIDTWNGYIIDGHHRYEICKKYNLSFKTEEVDLEDELAVKQWMIKNQFNRRNMPIHVRLDLALEFEKFEKEKARGRQACGQGGVLLRSSEDLSNIEKGKSLEKVSKLAETSYDTAFKYKKIKEAGLKDQVVNGDSIKKVYKELKSKERKEVLNQHFSKPQGSNESENYQIIQSSISDLKKHIKPNSIDAIITDPPYPEEYISLFDQLGEFASYALKDGAPCVVMTGQAYLGEYINLLSKNLDYHWTLAYMLPGSTAQIWGRRVGNTWKPVLLFSKGKFDWTFFQDSLVSPKPSKDHHEWGQSVEGFQQLVQRFSMKDGLVCDPFCGAGTTGPACLKEGRHFVGADIDEESIYKTQTRLADLECLNA